MGKAKSFPRTSRNLFGKDHWSLLAYAETCCVDGSAGTGQLDGRRIRVNPGSHPLVPGNGPLHWKAEYGSRLNDGTTILDHDDVDCLDDLEAEGLLEVRSLANLLVNLTSQGRTVSAALRAHKLDGGTFGSFRG